MKDIEPLLEALRDVANPMDALRKYAASQARELDGPAAHRIASDPGYIKSIARDALKAWESAA